MDGVVHFEIPADDLDRAKEFYSEIFGWKMNDMPEMKYVIAWTGETDPESGTLKEKGMINGGMMQRDPEVSHPVITIDVKDIDESMMKIKEMGGEELKAKMEVGDMGYAAYFKDTEGNVMGLWQNK
ncbi:TPA: VOC family protein [Candidatus Berkelbacteria bacterium]|uniref:Glyoxalase/bleomycin resistance protein/dioxygenase n=1 Tax=Berkelbacteria bacterium GW2011_GWE1_39_12 TaxID=1618337 RepID=A0A0G4B5D1_9BACT|nr:MAG: glyoxalase/bleomycin resistance protein/dioxygenase [Berkelbacteria bacterium GW2011_GWE1_39_12]HBO60285.1 VOC family protein [Candidatus Berkelbacteria bacterium]